MNYKKHMPFAASLMLLVSLAGGAEAQSIQPPRTNVTANVDINRIAESAANVGNRVCQRNSTSRRCSGSGASPDPRTAEGPQRQPQPGGGPRPPRR